MTMTLTEIEDHAGTLRARLTAERRKTDQGGYGGSRRANLRLIGALEGRVDELVRQCRLLQEADASAPRPAA